MKLKVDLVAEQVLAEGAADDRLHGMLGNNVHLDAISIFATVITVWALLNLV